MSGRVKLTTRQANFEKCPENGRYCNETRCVHSNRWNTAPAPCWRLTARRAAQTSGGA
jgi:hypothetical protein